MPFTKIFDPVADFNKSYFDFKFAPIGKTPTKADLALVEALSRKITGYKYQVENDRSNLSKVFDFLSLPLYTTAGFVKGLTDSGVDEINPFEGAWKGFKSGFTGEESGRYTYSKVMQGMGWKPESTLGKVGQGVLGFGLDVLLDPLTYLSGGTSALVRGTGRAGVGFTHAKPFVKSIVEEYGLKNLDVATVKAEELAGEVYQKVFSAYSGRGLSVAEKIASEKADEVFNTLNAFDYGLDVDKAKNIIEARMKSRGITLTDDEILSDAEKFADKFNKVIGLRETPEHGLNLSLKNLPFGEKYFPNAKRLELTTPEGAQKFGEATVAPIYSALRNFIYGTKFAEKFSTVTPLYRASKEDPGIIYDFVKMIDITQGLTKDKLAQAKAIKEWAEVNLKDLKPHEMKQILDLLEDKTMWGALKREVKLLDSKEAKVMRNELARQHESYKKELDDLLEMQDTLHTSTFAIDNDLVKANQGLDVLRKDYDEKLASLSFDETTGLDNLEKINKLYQNEYDELRKTTYDNSPEGIANIKRLHEDFIRAGNDNLIQGRDNLLKSMDNVEIFVDDGKYINGKYVDGKYVDGKWQDAQYVGVSPQDKLEQIEGQLNQIQSTAIGGKGQLEAKIKLVDALSEYIYGESGHISKNLFLDAYHQLVDLIDGGATPEQLLEHIQDNFIYTNKQEMFQFIARKLGYGSKNSEYKSWREFYTERYNKLMEKHLSGEGLNHGEKLLLAELGKADVERRRLLAMFNKMDSYDDVLDYIRQDDYKYGASGMYREEVAEVDSLKARQDAIEKSGATLRNKVQGIDAEISKLQTEIESIKKTKLEKTTVNLVERKLTKKDIKEINQKIKNVEKSLVEHQKMLDKKEFGVLLSEKVVKRVIDNLNVELKGYRESLTSGVKKVKRVVRSESKTKRISDLTKKIDDLKIEKEKIMKDKVFAETSVKGFLPHERAGILEDIYKNSRYKNYSTRKYAEKVVADMEIFLDELGISWSDASLAQKKAIRKLSKVNVQRIKDKQPRISWKESIDMDKQRMAHEEAMKRHMGKQQVAKERLEKVEEVISKEPALEQKLSRLDDLSKLIDEVKLKIDDYHVQKAEIDSKRLLQIEELQRETTERAVNMLDKIHELQNTKRDIMIKMQNNNVDIYDDEKKIERLEKILDNDDVFETYVRANLTTEQLEEATNFVDVTKIMLDGETTVDDKIKSLTKLLNQKFTEIGASEVEAGVLKQEQVNKWINGYVTRVLTEDGLRYLGVEDFDDNVQAALTRDYGYGRVKNQFANSRVKEFDGYTINQINKEMSEKLKGKNMFSDCIFDIYQTRALQNLEILYDTNYTKNMMNIFGSEIQAGVPIKKGYKPVVNYIILKQEIDDYVKFLSISSVKPVEEIREGVLKSLGITEDTVGLNATPMVELTNEQLKFFSQHERFNKVVRQVHGSLVDKANQTRKLQMLKDHNRMMQNYDKLLHFIKLQQTVIMPSFHMRNKFSNIFNNWLGVGQDATNLNYQRNAFRTVRNAGKNDEIIEGTNMTWRQVYDLALANGVIDEGYFAKDVGAHARVQGKLRRWLAPKYDITDTKNFFAYKIGTDVGGTIENTDRLIHFMSRLKSGDNVWQAAESVEKYLFDYSNITVFEQHVMKRIFPYYVWMRKNSALQVEQLLEKPFKYAMVAKATHAIENSNDEKTKMDPRYVDRFAQDWIQLPFTVKNPKGTTERVMLNPNMPYMGLNQLPSIMSPVKSAEDLISQMAPMLKAPIELGLNRNMKFEQPIFKEGTKENPATPVGTMANYLFSNFAGYNVGKDMVQKDGLDLGLQTLNNVSGIKLLSYDYETYKSMKMKSKMANNYLTSDQMDEKYRSFFSDVGGSLVSGFKGCMSRAIGDKPDAFNYEGALRPISKKTYDSLSEEDKVKYVPPTLDEAIVYNKQAKELEAQQLKESGVFKRFVWTLLDTKEVDGETRTIGRVTKVRDGDTFEVDINGKKEIIRLLLIDTPESVGSKNGRKFEENPMPFGKEASNYSKKALFGKDVKLIFDGGKTDKYDRMVAYVSVDGEDYNEKLLSEGLAQVRYLFQSDYKNKSKYYKAEKEAYKQKKGIWSRENYAFPGDDTDFYE